MTIINVSVYGCTYMFLHVHMFRMSVSVHRRVWIDPDTQARARASIQNLKSILYIHLHIIWDARPKTTFGFKLARSNARTRSSSHMGWDGWDGLMCSLCMVYVFNVRTAGANLHYCVIIMYFCRSPHYTIEHIYYTAVVFLCMNDGFDVFNTKVI